jgi:hypothetical protein
MSIKRSRKKCQLCGSTWGVSMDRLCINHRREKYERINHKPFKSMTMFFYNTDMTPINPKNKFLTCTKDEVKA